MCACVVCLYVGSVVLLAIAVLSQFFHYIPKTSLSAIIIAAVLPMVDVRILYRIFKIRGDHSSCVYTCVDNKGLEAKAQQTQH